MALSQQKYILILGQARAGKTTLLQLLMGKPLASIPSTKGITSTTLTLDNKPITIYDTAAIDSYSSSILNTFYINTNLMVYCVDLSKPIDIKQTKDNINNFRQLNQGPIILIGTKKDIEHPDNIPLFEQIETDFSFFHQQMTSSTDNNLEAFKKAMLHALYPDESHEIKFKFSQFDQALNKIIPNSPIGRKLYQLKRLAQETMSKEDYIHLGQEVLDFVTRLESNGGQYTDESIQIFSDNCHKIVNKYQHSDILKLVSSIVAFILISTLIMAAGCALGYFLGAWVGPLAFVAAIASGDFPAIATFGVGLTAGLFSSYACFFRQTPLSNTLNEVIDLSRESQRGRESIAAH